MKLYMHNSTRLSRFWKDVFLCHILHLILACIPCNNVITNRKAGKHLKRKLMAGILGLFLAIRLFPAFAIFWGKQISLPLLDILERIGTCTSFVLLEWMLGAICTLLLLALLRRKLLKAISSLAIAGLLVYLAIWYPLYFLPRPTHAATPHQIAQLCSSLIDQLNASELSFPDADDLPAKFIRFPEWMNALNITGLCAFPTGEALITPELESVSRPFVAVHEYMHLQGYAGEGAANIAAWEECMAQGGVYADSARIWALRYGMGMLRRDAVDFYDAAMLRMNHETLQFYRQAGGAHSLVPHAKFLSKAYTALGIETALLDYEILASYLAAQYPK